MKKRDNILLGTQVSKHKVIHIDDFLNKKIAILSDIHSNADSLKVAYEHLNRLKVDIVVILGDLLTYGCQVKEVLDLLKVIEKEFSTYFIIGNHDEFYFNIQANEEDKNYHVPDFIRESIKHNFNLLEANLSTYFHWNESISFGGVYISHANPYGFGNWDYVNSTDDSKKAAKQLESLGYDVGVFGHSHRPMFRRVAEGDVFSLTDDQLNHRYDDKSVHLINPGTIGQPRGEGTSFGVLEINHNSFSYLNIVLKVDHTNYMAKLKKSKMSQETIFKLLSYLG